MGRFREQDGAAAVEMGLLLPLLVVLAFGTIQFSTAYNRSQAMEAAVREGARAAASGEQSESDVEQRVEMALANTQAGSGFPAPGGSGSVGGDVDVSTYSLTEADLATHTDANPDNDAEGTVLSGGTDACRAAEVDDHAVRVVAEVAGAHRDAYSLELALVPSISFDRTWEAVFPCLT